MALPLRHIENPRRPLWQLTQDSCHIATVVGRFWFEECGANPCSRPLGKLGERLAHDQRQAPRSGNALENDTASPCLTAASRAAQDFDGVEDFEVLQWRELAAGLRPPLRSNLGAGWREFRTKLSVEPHVRSRPRFVCGTTSCPPVAPVQPHLPVWPSTRRFWPLPCSVREVWSAQITSCRRFATFWRGLTHRGHNPRFCSSRRWRTSARCRRQGWRGTEESPSVQGSHVP